MAYNEEAARRCSKKSVTEALNKQKEAVDIASFAEAQEFVGSSLHFASS